MKLIARKPCSFGGEKFYIGDEIPAEYVLNPKEQEKLGVIAIVNGDGCDLHEGSVIVPDVTLSILVHTEDGDMNLEPTDEGIQDVFTVLIGTAEGAKSVISQMTDSDALMLLHMADKRTTVQTMAKERGKELAAEESAGEQ